MVGLKKSHFKFYVLPPEGGRAINAIIVDEMAPLWDEVLDTKDSENAPKDSMRSGQFESDERNAQVQNSKW
jgi:hypothetical protein